MSAPRKPAWSGLPGQATALLAWVAGALLIGMTVLIAVAVIMRKLVGAPILGVNEIVQLVAVALVMLALPHATRSGAHVRADIFDPALGRWGRAGADILTRLLSIYVFRVLIGRAWDKALEAHEFGDATNMLSLPLWPFYGLIVLGIGLAALVMALELLTVLLTRRPIGEHNG